jgi:valyl-tRNA synthetase
LPVYYGPNEEIVVCGPGETPPEGFTQDPDVLDTWFSSGLWPFSTLGWPEKSADLEKFYPTSVLVTGYDILFFWVARMMMLGLYAMEGTPPFHTIALHGLVRDKFGKKMSKSRGNVVDPIEFMDKYGSDALRFTLARMANPGSDQALAEEWIGGSRNFATKLWNASRFAMMNGANIEGPLPEYSSLTVIDQWILTCLNQTIEAVDSYLETFEFSKALELLYHFAWDDLCDWYLELTKSTFASNNSAQTARVLGHVLDNLLRLLHPAMPFITEELWCNLTGAEGESTADSVDSIVIAPWPTYNKSQVNEQSIAAITRIQEIITEIRRFRNDQGIKTSAKIIARFTGLGDLSFYEEAIRFIVRCEKAEGKYSAKIEVGTIIVEFDLTGAIDVKAERARLTKDLATAQKDLATAKVKLQNDGFMAKAPLEVVTEIRERLAVTTAEIERLEALLAALPLDASSNSSGSHS